MTDEAKATCDFCGREFDYFEDRAGGKTLPWYLRLIFGKNNNFCSKNCRTQYHSKEWYKRNREKRSAEMREYMRRKRKQQDDD